MANTYSQIYMHIIFAVYDRECLIKDEWRDELYRYISGACRNRKHLVYAINGMPDHVHLLVGMNPSESVSQLVQSIKLQSSKWINDHFPHGHFHWQSGYGAFSYSKSLLPNVIKYISNQQKHHQHFSNHDELIDILEKAGIEYNPNYIMKGFV
jgi:REP element-mobilizing transposase RayT